MNSEVGVIIDGVLSLSLAIFHYILIVWFMLLFVVYSIPLADKLFF
jgi:hypothetical protein